MRAFGNLPCPKKLEGISKIGKPSAVVTSGAPPARSPRVSRISWCVGNSGLTMRIQQYRCTVEPGDPGRIQIRLMQCTHYSREAQAKSGFDFCYLSLLSWVFDSM